MTPSNAPVRADLNRRRRTSRRNCCRWIGTSRKQYQEERAETLREEEKDELIHQGEHRPYPPTRYE